VALRCPWALLSNPFGVNWDSNDANDIKDIKDRKDTKDRS
jgi:hypothetical protein